MPNKGQLKAVTCDSNGKLVPFFGGCIWRIAYVANGRWELQRFHDKDVLDQRGQIVHRAGWSRYQRPTDRDTAVMQLIRKAAA